MPVNLGEAIGLGSNQKIRSGEITQAANRFMQFDQGKRSAQAKREAEDQKYADEINKSLTLRIGKLNTPRTEQAMQVVSEFAQKSRPRDGKMDKIAVQTEYEKAFGKLQQLQKEQDFDDENAKVYQSSRNAFGRESVLDYEKTIKNDPYLATILYENTGTNVPRLRGVQYVNPTEYENKIANAMKEQLQQKLTGKTLGSSKETIRVLTDDMAKNLAIAEVGDGSTDYAINLYVQNKDRVLKTADQLMRVNPQLSGQGAINQALTGIAQERILQQGKFYDIVGTREPRTSGDVAKAPKGFNATVQAPDIALSGDEETTKGGVREKLKGDIAFFSKASGKGESAYKQYRDKLPLVTLPSASETEKKTVFSGGGNAVTNTDILYLVQDPITKQWYARVSDETATKKFNSKLLSSDGYLALNETNLANVASGFKTSVAELKMIMNEATNTALGDGGGKQQKTAKLSFPEWKKQNPNGGIADFNAYKSK